MDLSVYLSTMSMNMAQTRNVTDVSLAMLKNTMNTEQAAGSRLIEDLSEMAPSADGRGALLDVRA